jgi:hypothetical protein
MNAQDYWVNHVVRGGDLAAGAGIWLSIIAVLGLLCI